MFHILTFVLSLALMTAPAWANQDTLSLKQAEALALKQNPGLAARKANAIAMAQIPDQAGSLPDPRLWLNAMNLPVDSFSISQENMTQIQVGLSQAIPFPGKLALREQAAAFEAKAAGFDEKELRLKLIRNVRIRWWNLFHLDRALEIVRRNQALLRQFIRIAETKYKTGQGLQQDVLLAQAELSKLLDVEISLKGSRRNQQALLNALLNRPTQHSIRLPQTVEEALITIPGEADLHQTAFEYRPLLAMQTSRVNAAERRVRLAQKDYYPDFKLGAGYGFRQGINPASGKPRPDFASFMLSINIPLYASSKQTRAVEQRKAELVRTEFTKQDVKEAILAEISQALADYVRARDKVALFKSGIIPQAAQTVSSMLAGYQVNKVDFLNLVRAQITLLNYETQYWLALTQAKQALARLSAAVGKDISHE